NLHVLGYLKAFLFTPDRARTAVKMLSGGERNRLLLARLFAKPSNVLVLDEPTNDLDIETLELLENLVADYPGTVILVSHDRAFVNNVVDGLLVNEGDHGFRYHVGNYNDWLRQQKSSPEDVSTSGSALGNTQTEAKEKQRPTKLGYKDQRELEQLPQRILALEAEVAQWHKTMSDPDFFRQSSDEIKTGQIQLVEAEQKLSAAYARWEELETLQSELGLT
ncbi:MAG: ATP-binding cassette domain-containing protein, partial [Chloroflexota bacterium]